MNESFIDRKNALFEEYLKQEKEARAAFAKVNQLYADRIMDTMKKHGVKEIVLYDENRDDLYPVYTGAKYYDSENRYHTIYDDTENQRYYIYTYEVTSEDGETAIWKGIKEFWICRFAIMDDRLMMGVQEFDPETERYSEEGWRPFSEIDNIHDLEFKEPLIRWLEESEEAFDIVREHPELLALKD